MLKVDDLHVSYGKIRAVNGVSMEVRRGEIVSLVGANGAGKTTLVNSIMGLIGVQKGRIELAGKDITHSPPWIRARMGMVLVPESGRIFTSMSVMENLELGAYLINDRVKFKQRLNFVLSLFPRFLLAEQNTKKALEISDRTYVLQNGKVVKHGKSSLLMADPEIKRAYLGV